PYSYFVLSCSSAHAFTISFCFFFNPPPPPTISTLSLHDALPISPFPSDGRGEPETDLAEPAVAAAVKTVIDRLQLELRVIEKTEDRKSTRLNSSHRTISYAVFCLKKKKKKKKIYNHKPKQINEET